MKFLLLASLFVSPINGGLSVLDRIAVVESGGYPQGQWAVGDRGASRGCWQMKRAAWTDVTRMRKKSGLTTSDDWKKAAHDLHVSRIYAQDFIEIQRTRFMVATNLVPTADQVYLLHLCGFRRARELGFQTTGLPARIQSKIDKFRATK